MTLDDFLNWYLDFNQFSGIPCLLFFILFQRSWRSTAGIIFYIVLFSFLADSISYFYVRFVFPNSYIIGNIWYAINYIVLTVFFIRILPSSRRLMILLAVGFAAAYIGSFVFVYSMYDANPVIRVYTSVSFIVMPLAAYLSMLKRPSGRLSHSPIFWANTALFIFSSVTLLRNLFQQYLAFDLQVSTEVLTIIYLIYCTANISKNFLLFYSIALINKGYPDTISVKENG